MQNLRTGDLSNLDFLRAVAVTLVLCDHLLAKFHVDRLGRVATNHIGHFGVLLFFVHTSLVLMYSLERSRMTGTRLLGNFYLRRIFRIYPLSIVAVCITIGLGLSSTGGHGLVTSPSPSWGQAASNLFLVQNLTRSDSILGPLWSLPLELQMYALLPFLFLLTRRTRALPSLLALWCVAVVVAHFYLRSHALEQLSLLGYIPNFLPGVLAYSAWSVFPENRRLAAYWWPGYVLLLIGVYLLRPQTATGWLVCLVLGLSIPLFKEITTGWLCWISKRVATYSFGIYLAHSFCVWLAFSVLSGHSVYVRVAVLLLTIITLPVLLYHSIEHPMIQLGGALARVPSPRTAATEVPAPVVTVASQTSTEGSQIPVLNVHDAS